MESKETQVDLARKRTELAIQRNVMAIERTYSAWLRTGVSAVLAGLAIVKFIGERESVHFYVVLIGMIFVGSGILIYLLAYLNFRNNLKQLNYKGENVTRLSSFLAFITLAMTVSAVLIFGLLFLD